MAKKVIALVMALVLTLTLVGCRDDNPLKKKNKKELIELVETLVDEVESQEDRIEELEEMLKGVQEEKDPSAAISEIDDGTGRLTFNSIDGKIQFPVPFEYPGSTQAPNTSSVGITATLRVVPSNNWVTVLDGTTLELEHKSGISGIMRAGQIMETYDMNGLQDEVMSVFFEELPPTTVQYNRLFLDEQWWGLEAQAPTKIDNKDAQIRCGMVGLGEQSLTYIFVYQGEKDNTKDETITSLLRTVEMMGMPLRIE